MQEIVDNTLPVMATLKDKFSFTLGILTIGLSQFLATRYPDYFIYFWIPLTILLWSYKWVAYSTIKWELFMIDFCYFINVSVAIQMIFYPTHLLWFQANYVLATGPTFFAIIVYGNSLVFHDIDKVTNLFLHAFPGILIHMYRWNYIKNELPIKAGDKEDTLSLTTGLAWPLVLYGIWQISYILITNVFLYYYLKDKSVVTSCRYYMKGKGKQRIFKLMEELLIRLKIMKLGEQLDPDTILGKAVFIFLQLGYTILTIAPVHLTYKWYAISMTQVILVLISLCWNGASYYIEVFSVRYRLKFEKTVGSSTIMHKQI